MNFKLTRSQFGLYGIYGELKSEDGFATFATLEHAFAAGSSWVPVIPPGSYTCVRGDHRLDDMPIGTTFSTFMITGVAGHTKLLFHWGNYNADSDGCILLGLKKGTGMIEDSRVAFAQFMEVQEGVDSFILTVV